MPIKHAADFNRDVMPTVVCVNKVTADLGVDFDKLVPALQQFLDELFVPVWGTPAKLVKSNDGQARMLASDLFGQAGAVRLQKLS